MVWDRVPDPVRMVGTGSGTRSGMVGPGPGPGPNISSFIIRALIRINRFCVRARTGARKSDSIRNLKAIRSEIF